MTTGDLIILSSQEITNASSCSHRQPYAPIHSPGKGLCLPDCREWIEKGLRPWRLRARGSHPNSQHNCVSEFNFLLHLSKGSIVGIPWITRQKNMVFLVLSQFIYSWVLSYCTRIIIFCPEEQLGWLQGPLGQLKLQPVASSCLLLDS